MFYMRHQHVRVCVVSNVEIWFLVDILKEWNPTNPTINLYLLEEASLEQF